MSLKTEHPLFNKYVVLLKISDLPVLTEISTQRIHQEIIGYYRMMGDLHPNVVLSLGFVTSDSPGLGLVVPEHVHGTVTQYLGQNPAADRERLVSGSTSSHTECLISFLVPRYRSGTAPYTWHVPGHRARGYQTGPSAS